jgi:hypothetical protein
MSGDPRECRKRALQCAELAQKARTPEHAMRLVELNWEKLAIDLERARALIEEYSPDVRKRA